MTSAFIWEKKRLCNQEILSTNQIKCPLLSIKPSGFSPKVWFMAVWQQQCFISSVWKNCNVQAESENIPLLLMQNTFNLTFNLLKWLIEKWTKYLCLLLASVSSQILLIFMCVWLEDELLLSFFLNLSWKDHRNLAAVLFQWINCNEEMHEQ